MNLKSQQYWAIIVTLLFHVILFWFLFFTEMQKRELLKEYELELAPEPKQSVEEKEKIEKIAETEVRELLSSKAAKRYERGEKTVREKITTEQLKAELEELKSKQPTKASLSKPKITFEKEEIEREMKDTIEETEPQTVFYVGKSRVEYFLAERYRVALPIPVYQCEGGGLVEVAIDVNKKGVVVSAEVIKKRSKSASDCMHEAALQAALASVFSERPEAPEIQKGRIVYKFAPQ